MASAVPFGMLMSILKLPSAPFPLWNSVDSLERAAEYSNLAGSG